MATIVNNPGGGNDSGSAAGWLVALVVLILVVLAAIFLLPRLATPTPAPTQGTEDTVVVPPATTNTYNTTINVATGTGTTTP